MPSPYKNHQDQPTIAEANTRYEVHTATNGVESDTSAFFDPRPEAKILDHTPAGKDASGHPRRITYDGGFIGTFRTCTQGTNGRNSLVKMHLVNSYLHPNANIWQSNWFWGSYDLNKKHTVFEAQAKLLHPANGGHVDGKPVTLLRYATRAGDAKPSSVQLDDFKNLICEKLKRMRNQTRGANEDAPLDENSIKIGGKALDAFHAEWVAAIAECAASSFEVKYSAATGQSDNLKWGVAVVSPQGESKIINEEYLPDVNGAPDVDGVWLTAFPMPPRKRKREPSDEAEDDRAKKKAKSVDAPPRKIVRARRRPGY